MTRTRSGLASFTTSGEGSSAAKVSSAPASTWIDGSLTVKLVPRPCALSTETVPASMSANALVSERPRPVPPNLRVVELSACWKRWNSLSNCSGVMPMPVSDTLKQTSGPASPASRHAAKVTVPLSVNLAALPRMLSNICRTLVRSECMVPRSG